MTRKRFKLLSEQEQINWVLYKNIKAKKTNSELDLINLTMFKGRTFSAEYKKKLYSQKSWTQRLWWKQKLILFNKPTWWNQITGWEKVGLMKIISVKGPFFVKTQRIQSRLFKFKLKDYNTTVVFKDKKPYFIQFNSQLKYRYFRKTKHYVTRKLFKRLNLLNLKIKFTNYFFNNYSTNLTFRNVHKYTLSKQNLYLNQIKSIQQIINYTLIITKITNINYNILSNIIVDVNIKIKEQTFKHNLIAMTFLKKIRYYRLRDNAYYLSIIDFRISLLYNKFYWTNGSLLSSYYSQQLSLLAARRTQRWFVRDIRFFNKYFYIMSQQTKFKKLQLINYQLLHFNVKGRLADTRRVFSRQHSTKDGVIPKSKYIVNYNKIPSYSQGTLTTKWGSTNLRLVYFSNPYYHNYFKNQLKFNRQNNRKFWFNSVHYYSFIHKTNINVILNYYLFLLIFKRWSIKNNWQKKVQSTKTSILRYRKPEVFYTQNVINIYKSYFVNKVRMNKIIKTNKYALQKLSETDNYYINDRFITDIKITPFMPSISNVTRTKWVKYINKKFYNKFNKRSHFKNFYSKRAIMKIYKLRKINLNKFNKYYWFNHNVLYFELGHKLSKLKQHKILL